MTQHTPGPWTVDGEPTKWVSAPGTSPKTKRVVCEVWETAVLATDPDHRTHDARLIAAAPELLEALKNLVERNLIRDPNGDHYQEVLEAIAKATGG